MTFESETLEPPKTDLCVPGEPVGAVELRRAVEIGRASFPQILKAYWLAERHGPYRKWGAEQKRDAPCYRQLFRELLPAFECAHGPVDMSFYADGIPGAVVLTRTRSGPEGTACDAALAADMQAVVWWEELTFNAHLARTLFSDLMQLRDRVTSFIPCEEGSQSDKAPEERNRLLHEIYCIGCDLIASLECEQKTRDAAEKAAGTGAMHTATGGSETDPSARHLGEVADLRARLAAAEANYQGASKRIGQRWFLPGIRTGGLAAALLLAIFAALSTYVLHWDDVWAATAAAGVAGAIVSVLQRMTSGSLAISAEADPQMVRTIGYCRIALGVGLGVISYVVVGGGLVALSPPSGSTPALYFAGIAFIAGFSERFARDMLAAPTHLLDGLKGTKPAAAPTPAPAAH